MEWIDALTVFILFAPEIVFIMGVLFIASAFCFFYVVWKIYHDSIDTKKPLTGSVILNAKTPSGNYCIKESKQMTMEHRQYCNEKEQLLTRIDCLIRELDRLSPTVPAECILCLANRLEARLESYRFTADQRLPP